MKSILKVLKFLLGLILRQMTSHFLSTEVLTIIFYGILGCFYFKLWVFYFVFFNVLYLSHQYLWFPFSWKLCNNSIIPLEVTGLYLKLEYKSVFFLVDIRLLCLYMSYWFVCFRYLYICGLLQLSVKFKTTISASFVGYKVKFFYCLKFSL